MRESDGEFEPDNATSTDDEETIAQEEKLNSCDSAKNQTEREQEEIDALKRESEIPIEELLDDLPLEYLESLRKAGPIAAPPKVRVQELSIVENLTPLLPKGTRKSV